MNSAAAVARRGASGAQAAASVPPEAWLTDSSLVDSFLSLHRWIASPCVLVAMTRPCHERIDRRSRKGPFTMGCGLPISATM
jgi:hypothetical protein